MKSSELYLFKDRRFLPIFIVQLCGCLNDSILKNALIILITFKLTRGVSLSPYLLVMLVNVVFIAPFALFASLAGQIADKYERASLVKIIKLAEIGIVSLGAYGFYHTNLIILFICIGLMGIHSTFFGPIKYSVLPDKLEKKELLEANGYVEAGTFFSILVGTIIGGFYNSNNDLIIFIAVVIALIGFGSSLFVPDSYNSNPSIKINFNIIKENIELIKYSYSRTQLYLAILGISWFWFIGAAILAQIPSLTKTTLGGDENVANLFLATFSIGVGVGSFWCSRIFANQITTKYIFISALGISVFCTDLYFASRIAEISYQPEQLKNIFEFLAKKHYWRILIDLFCIAAIGGIYVVPLFAVMQYFTSSAYRSRVVAVNNLINSGFMAVSTIILSLLFYLGFSIPTVILVVSILNIIVAFYIYRLIPNTRIVPFKLWRLLFRIFFNILYKVEVKGLDNYKKAGKKTVIIANHLSYIDPPLIAAYIPDNIMFAINMTVARQWWVKPFLKIARTFKIEPNNPMGIKSLIEQVKKERKVAIFPEGRTSMTGSLMKIYEGPGMIADKAGATILPVRVDGTQFTCFAKVRNIMKTGFKWRRNITVTILPPIKIIPPAGSDNKERRKFIARELYDVMSNMIFESSPYKDTIFQALINAAKTFNYKKLIIEDVMEHKINYRQLIFRALLLGGVLAKKVANTQVTGFQAIGLLIPNEVDGMVVFFATQAINKTVAMINFTDSHARIISACKTAEVKVIITTGKFVREKELRELIKVLEINQIKIIYLEELRMQIKLLRKLIYFPFSYFPQTWYNYLSPDKKYHKPAVILFAEQDQDNKSAKKSTKEGTEETAGDNAFAQLKAIVLSHENILASKYQLTARIDFNPYDNVFSALPLFNYSGLTTSLIMCLSGVRMFLYPYLSHYHIVSELIYDIGATVIFGTDHFLANCAKFAHPYDFYSLRYVIANDIKLQNSTRKLWQDKFGIRIFSAYGLAEAGAFITINTPMYNRLGTLGRLLPKIEYSLKKITERKTDNINEEGILCIYGPNIMLGYILPENPGVVIPPRTEELGTGWYETSTLVKIDNEGYISLA